MDRLPIGVAELDRRLRGGAPAGTLVALVAPPPTQSELLLRSPVDANGGAHLSTLRPAAEVSENVSDSATVAHARPDELLANARSLLEPVGDGETVVVDPVNEPEAVADRDRCVDFLATLKARLRETDGVGFLRALEQAAEPSLRWLTLARGDRSLDEPLRLRLTDQVTVDTSRDI